MQRSNDDAVRRPRERQELFELRARQYAARRLSVPDADAVVANVVDTLAGHALDPSAGEIEQGIPGLAWAIARLHQQVAAADNLAQRRGADPQSPDEVWWEDLRSYMSGGFQCAERARFELDTLESEDSFEGLISGLLATRAGEIPSRDVLAPIARRNGPQRWVLPAIGIAMMIVIIVWVVLVER